MLGWVKDEVRRDRLWDWEWEDVARNYAYAVDKAARVRERRARFRIRWRHLATETSRRGLRFHAVDGMLSRRLTQLRDDQARLLEVMRTGRKDREVKVYYRPDYAEGIMRVQWEVAGDPPLGDGIVREDRPLTMEERQLSILR